MATPPTSDWMLNAIEMFKAGRNTKKQEHSRLEAKT